MHFSSLVRLQLLSDMEIWFRKLIVVEYFVSFFVFLVSLQSKVLIQNKGFYFISRHSVLCLYDVCHVWLYQQSATSSPSIRRAFSQNQTAKMVHPLNLYRWRLCTTRRRSRCHFHKNGKMVDFRISLLWWATIRRCVWITNSLSIYFIINYWLWWHGPNDWTTWSVCQFCVG